MAKKYKQKPDKDTPVVHDYSDHAWCIKGLQAAQEADHDNRERAREAHDFVSKKNGQWEDEWWQANDGKPRYTFDLTTPIIEQIAGEIEEADFAIEVEPAGGQSTSDDADLLAGIVRSIENMSEAPNLVYSQASRGAITCGLDGWRVCQDYVDADSFDQDLKIEWIPNFIDRVWFDLNSETRTHADSKHAWLMHALTPEDYKAQFPGRDPHSNSIEIQNIAISNYWAKRDVVVVGELYYIKHEKRTLIKMSNGNIYQDDESFQSVIDELAQQGITEVTRREREVPCVYIRKFDAQGWLEEPQKTVFKHIPIVPVYANFKIIDNKLIYWGATEKLMDAQRVLNYALSREIEEVAMSPRRKYWMTEIQAQGYTDTIETLNTNNHPVQFFNPDERVPGPPQQIGGSEVNPGLANVVQTMNATINQIAGLFAANMGDNPNAQSGIAIKRLQDKGDNGTRGYVKAHEIALAQTFRILVGAIPELYHDEREVRIINNDGTQEVVQINQNIIDQQTGRMVTLHDLSAGVYKVTCRAGPSFKNRQEETVNAILQAAQVDPTVIQLGGDVFYKNIDAPGMDTISERLRQQLLNQGLIPFKQLTDEEKQELMLAQQQAAQQGQGQMDPAMLIGQAELITAQAGAQEKQMKAQEAMMKLQLQARRENREDAKLQFTRETETVRMMMEQQRQMMDAINAQAQTLKAIREAMGADMAMSPDAAEAYQKQAQMLNRSF